jgi:Gpi18-like mannosyltransferase
MRTAAVNRRGLPAVADVRFCLIAFLLGRVLYSTLAVIGWQLPHEAPESATGWAAQPPSRPWFAAFTGLEHFDAQWYLQIASDGYAPGDPSSAFFPLYPLAIRCVGVLLGGHWLLAAYLVSSASLVVALLLLHSLTATEVSPRAARPTIVLLLSSPLGFFLYAPYSESLFLALTLACVHLLRSRRFALAAAAAALSSATRSTGVLLGAAIAAQALADVRWRPRCRPEWRRLAATLPWSLGAAGGLVAYLAYWEAVSSWHEPLDVQRTAFRREATYPWTALADGLRIASQTLTESSWLIANLCAAVALGSLALGVLAVRRTSLPIAVWVAASLVFPLCLVRPFAPLTSIARYYLVVFPLWWALARLMQGRPLVRAAVLTTNVTLGGLLTLLFASWHDVI